MNENAPVVQNKADSFAVAFEQARNNILQKFAPMKHTVHGVGIGHTNVINAGAFTRDEKGLLTASWDGTAILWDIQSGLPIRRFVGHKGPLRALCLTEGRTFFTAGDDCAIRNWDMDTAQCLQILKGHRGPVECVYATADGLELLTAGRDTTAIVWSMATGRPARILEGHRDNVSCVCLSRDATRVITASFDKNVRVWERTSGRLLRVLPGEYAVNWVCTTPEDRIVAAYANNSCWLWTMEGRRVNEYRHHQAAMLRRVAEKECSPVRGPSFIESDNVRENAIKFSLLTSCSSVAAPSRGPFFFSTGWDRTCRQIAYDGDQIRCLEGHDRPVERVVLSGDDKIIATLGWDARAVIWDVKTGKPRKTLSGFTSPINDLALSPDVESLVTAGGNSAIVWDLKEGNPKLTLSGHTDRVNDVTYSPCGRYILTSSSDKTVIVWDAETASKVKIFESSAPVSQTICSRGMTLIAIADLKGRVTLYDFRSRMLIQKLGEHARGLSCVVFTPDSTRIVAASGDGTACMYDVRTGRRVLRLVHDDEVRCVSINPESSSIATGSLNGEVRLWNLRNGQMIFRILGAHQGGVNSVAFDSRGDRIISGGRDGLVRVWGCDGELHCQATGRGHHGEVTSIALSPCGKRLFSGSEDHTIKCWDYSQEKFAKGENDEIELELLVTMHNLEKGFLWTTPPDSTVAESCWFWTDRKDLIHVSCRTNDPSNETPVTGREKDDYISIHCRKDMVMSRISDPKKHEHLASQIRKAINGAREESLRHLEVSLRRRLTAG